MLDAYGFNKEYDYSNSEIFTRIMNVDYGRLFTIALIRIDLDLQSAGLIEEFVQKYEQTVREKQQEMNQCKVISKKYLSRNALNADNTGQPIIFDSEYDKTDYSFLKKHKDKKTIYPMMNLKNYYKSY